MSKAASVRKKADKTRINSNPNTVNLLCTLDDNPVPAKNPHISLSSYTIFVQSWKLACVSYRTEMFTRRSNGVAWISNLEINAPVCIFCITSVPVAGAVFSELKSLRSKFTVPPIQCICQRVALPYCFHSCYPKSRWHFQIPYF